MSPIDFLCFQKMIFISSLLRPTKQTSGVWPEERPNQGQKKFPKWKINSISRDYWWNLAQLLLPLSRHLSLVSVTVWTVAQLASRTLCLGIQSKAANEERADEEIAVASYREQPLLKEDFCCKVLRGRRNTLRSYGNFPAHRENIDLWYERKTLSPALSS